MNDDDDATMNTYITYNGFNRPAMIRGIPLMILIFSMMIAFFGGTISVYYFGAQGLMVPALLIPFLFTVKLVCEDDPNAMRSLLMNMQALVLKLKHKGKVVHFYSVR